MKNEKQPKRHNNIVTNNQDAPVGIVRAESSEALDDNQPTTLNLLTPYSPDELAGIDLIFSSGDQFKREVTTSFNARRTLVQDTERRAINTNEASVDIVKQRLLVDSSVTTALSYLAIHKELSEQGVSQEAIDDFFKRVVATSLKAYGDDIENVYTSVDGISKIILKPTPDAIATQRRNLILKDAGSPPSWFQGTSDDWKIYYQSIIGFSVFIDRKLDEIGISYPDINPTLLNNVVPGENVGRLFYTGLPDWLTEDKESHDVSTVIAELNDDLFETRDLNVQIDSNDRKISYLQKQLEKNRQQTANYLERRRADLFPSLNNFADHTLYFDAIEDFSSAESLDEIIENYAVSNRSMRDQTFLALWLENQLRTGQIISTVQDEIDTNLEQTLIGLFEDSKEAANPAEQKLAGLRQSNKKGFNALNFELRPLLRLLDDEELEYLQELTTSSTQLDSVIWEVAELLSDQMSKKGGQPIYKQTAITLDHYQKFRKKWYKKYWEWSAGQIASEIKQNEQTYLYAPGIDTERDDITENEGKATELDREDTDENVSQEELSDVDIEADEKGETPEKILSEIDHGNLNGWEIFYAQDHKDDPEGIMQISGSTLQEREAALAQFIGENNISCNIKPSSVINALDWLVTVPKEVEQIRPTQRVGDDEFKKIKRGDVRLLYKLHRDQQAIIFFIHQKKAMSYNL